MGHGHTDLTSLQHAVAQLFFQLTESRGFVVAGGAALIASGLVSRPTNDIDLFAVHNNSTSIQQAATSFEEAAHQQRWTTRRVVDQPEFVRLVVDDGAETLAIDLGRDSPPAQPPQTTVLGPTLADHDLAARKTLALYGRAEGRDFADVYHLADKFGRDRLLEWAHNQDPGFNTTVFADMLTALNRLRDHDIPIPPRQIQDLRSYFADWAASLR
ncbi:MAG: nucleotidyl transferase AbiEii/AbiGii toxin family protein [Actinopolymorphaceae bacterium]